MSIGIDPIAGLNEAQKAAVEQTDGAVLVLAGAGSGKTRVLSHRIAYIVQQKLAKPWQILAVTFTNKAARELKERVASITPGGDEVAAGTFHSTMLRVLRRDGAAIGFPKNFTIFDNDDSVRLVKLILNDMNEERFRPKTVHSLISNLKNDMVTPEVYLNVAVKPIDKIVAEVFPIYQNRLKRLAAMDFDDLLLKPLELFKNYPAVLNYWSNRWRYVHVDEYQDTNLAQFELVKMIAGPNPNLCVVGDDDQSIYGWRGARVENIFRFKDEFKGSHVFRLEQNYRSTQSILDLAHAIVSKSSKREEKKLWTDQGQGEKPIVAGLSTDYDEARDVADRIGKNVMSGKLMFKDHAVLFRTNSQSRLFEDIFRGRRFPSQVVGNVGFYNRKEVRDAVAYFKLCLNPSDDMALRRIISEPPRGIGTTTLEHLVNWANANETPLTEALKQSATIPGIATRSISACSKFGQQIESWINALSEEVDLAEWVNLVLEGSGYLKRLRDDTSMESQGRQDNIQAFISSIAEFAAHGGTLEEYIEQAALASDQDKYDPSADAIKLMTIHAAKGLEFPVIFVTGLERRMFPLQRDDSETDIDEERRLFYVAVTRAREELVLTYAKQRRVWGKMEYRSVSPFLREISDEMVEWESMPPSLGVPTTRSKMDSSAQSQLGFGNKADKSKSIVEKFSSSSKLKPWSESDQKDNGSDEVPAVRAGDLVEHPKFGRGIVITTARWKNDLKVSVEFDGKGVMQLLQGKAKLQPVKDFS
jgi:ATP-dependent DNA helicase UvrD/PcrA